MSDGQDFQYPGELARATIGLDDLTVGAVCGEAQRAPLVDEILCQRCRNRYTVFLCGGGQMDGKCVETGCTAMQLWPHDQRFS